MNKTLLAAAVSLILAAAPAWAAAKKAPKTLKEGKYQAQVTALACEACAAEVETTLKSFDGVEGVSVDQKASSVAFAIKKGAKVSVAKLQKSLKTASDKMGMGADYTLKDISPVKELKPVKG